MRRRCLLFFLVAIVLFPLDATKAQPAQAVRSIGRLVEVLSAARRGGKLTAFADSVGIEASQLGRFLDGQAPISGRTLKDLHAILGIQPPENFDTHPSWSVSVETALTPSDTASQLDAEGRLTDLPTTPSLSKLIDELARLHAGSPEPYLERRRHELTQLACSDVVVYCVVPTLEGVTNYRFESPGRGEALLEANHASKLTAWDLSRHLLVAQQPSAQFVRQSLRDELLPSDLTEDDGKLVFFDDPQRLGLLPHSVGHNNAWMIASDSLQDAYAKRLQVRRTIVEPSQFEAIVGYPETQANNQIVFGRARVAGPSIWKKYSDEFRSIVSRENLSLLDLDSKQALLDRMKHSQGIVLVTAHADEFAIHLPNGIAISTTDITQLKFEHAPFVILRVCNGASDNFAAAFLKAGAIGVWMNRGNIDPATANRHIRLFLEHLPNARSLEDAVNKVQQHDPSAGPLTSLFSFRLTTGHFRSPLA